MNIKLEVSKLKKTEQAHLFWKIMTVLEFIFMYNIVTTYYYANHNARFLPSHTLIEGMISIFISIEMVLIQ